MKIDFHSHVLPNVDDGSHSTDESVALLRQLAQQGITHVVATPHFYARHDTPAHFLEKRALAEQRLREEMAKFGDLPELLVGAEVRFFSGISDSEAVKRLTIAEKNYILIEMPATPWTDQMYRELAQLREKQGVTPILAHIDRYVSPLRNRDIPCRLAGLPLLVQANADFFLSGFTSPMALRLLKNEQIHLLGSDCHDLKHRPPRLEAARRIISRRLGAAALDRVDTLGEMVLFST